MKSLEDLFDEVRDMDIEDQASMDKVLEFKEQLIEESDDYMQILVKKLENVTITWKRPWYQVPCILTIQFKDVDVTDETTFLKGRLSKEESDRVEKKWRKFVKRFDVPNKLHCFARWKNRVPGPKINVPQENVRQYIAAYLAKGLQRTVRQVYKHVVNHYSITRRGPYSSDEEKIVDICFHHNPRKAPVILSEVLSREPRAIYNKLHHTIHGKPQKKRIRWNLNLATKFVKQLMECTGESLIGLKNKHIGIDVWRNLESEFDTQAEYLRQFWYNTLHCQIFCEYDITMKRVRRRVFKILRRSPYRVWTDIKWKDVLAEFPDGFTSQFIYYVTIRVFRFDQMHNKMSIDELVEHGLQKIKSKYYRNKRLKTLKFNEDGELEVIAYSKKFR